MQHRNPLTWPILELFDEEFGIEIGEPEPQAAGAGVEADTVYMAACDVLLTREGSDTFTLQLRHRGRVSEIRLTADIDEEGTPSLSAVVGSD